jgi:hypothetical protein
MIIASYPCADFSPKFARDAKARGHIVSKGAFLNG